MPVSGTHQTAPPVRTIWFGMRCDFTRRAISGAGERDDAVHPTVVVLPRALRPRSAGWPEPPFDRWLRERGIAIVEVDRLAGADLATIREVVEKRGITLGVGACFPFLVPASLRAALRCGVLNIHPSLLPELRGPEPVFHAYRLGLAETGVTVHLMDDGWDTGPIVAQERVPVPETGTAAQLEAELAHLGGRLLADVTSRWCEGELHPTPQDDAVATSAPVPADRDRIIPTGLSVFQATRFVQACGPLLARDTGAADPVPVGDVISPGHGDFDALRRGRRIVRVPCRDGVLWLRRQD